MDATGGKGSVFIPMDSWIYPALDRLGSLGLIENQQVLIRPWTRAEAWRQLQEAEDEVSYLQDDTITQIAASLLRDLKKELAQEPASSGIYLESAYLRYGQIVGPALSDGFHFGQTWWNDYGRPLGRGGSAIAGFAFRANRGRYFLYSRDELQRSPTVNTVTPQDVALLVALDITPEDYPSNAEPPPYLPSPAIPAAWHHRAIDLYAGLAIGKDSFSFGKQELYWGPSVMGPLSFSSNAEPTYNLRLVTDTPHTLTFTRQFITYKYDLVFGKLSGHKYPARPYFNGQKLDLLFGNVLEVGVTRWSLLFGVGHPMTIHDLFRNFLSFSSTVYQQGYRNGNNPGDRKTAFDFKLHIPHSAFTLYADSFADDQVNPLAAPRRVVWNPGIYAARLPFLHHLDARVEAASSEELANDANGVTFFTNNVYIDANTNRGFLLGNAVGRDARSIQFTSTYWLAAPTHFTGGFRQTKGGLNYLPGGSTITDVFFNASKTLSETFSIQAFAQYERFLLPVLNAKAQHNGSSWLQLQWTPNLRVKYRQ